jgi:hypothetical protein
VPPDPRKLGPDPCTGPETENAGLPRSQARGGPLRGGRVPPTIRTLAAAPSTEPRPHVRPPETGAVVEGADLARVDWQAFELTGVRLDLVQAAQVARAHGALVE